MNKLSYPTFCAALDVAYELASESYPDAQQLTPYMIEMALDKFGIELTDGGAKWSHGTVKDERKFVQFLLIHGEKVR